jgi:hypothetical protein
MLDTLERDEGGKRNTFSCRVVSFAHPNSLLLKNCGESILKCLTLLKRFNYIKYNVAEQRSVFTAYFVLISSFEVCQSYHVLQGTHFHTTMVFI